MSDAGPTGTAPDPDRTGPEEADVYEALDSVYDPELDRSLAELRYVDHVRIDGGDVSVGLRLPTGLCSPAFAWMMATGAREAIEALPGVESAAVSLRDHVDAEAVTGGVNAGASFEETFDDAAGDVEELRRTLDHKARMSRQHAAVTALLDAGVEPAAVVALTHGDLDVGGEVARLDLGDRVVSLDAEPFAHFVEKVEAMGLPTDPDAPLFLTPADGAIPPEEFESVRQLTRLSSVNMSGQAHQCSLLLQSRYDLEPEA